MMTDRECVALLQWALPHLRLRWPGFRKVRRQVCRRVGERISCLGLPGTAAYRERLALLPEEWAYLDRCCRITISRFFRDRALFRDLEQDVLPRLVRLVAGRGGAALACWCAGCASGEEPFSLAILWKLVLEERFPGMRLEILATDIDETVLERARQGRYGPGSLRELPASFRSAAFDAVPGGSVLREPFRSGVRFLRHDLRSGPPDGPFELVLCRNLAFTYFDEALQREVLDRIARAMVRGGALVVGVHERLPDGAACFEPWGRTSGIFRKR